MSDTNDQKAYYDAASSNYSEARYEGRLESYIQFVFRRRRSILFNFIDKIISREKISTVMEIGCADGILLRDLVTKYPNQFTKLRGIDISEGMIAEARNKTADPRISFILRGEEKAEANDLVIELGVHVYDLAKEMEYVCSNLRDGGYYIYSAASSTSLHTRFKLKNADYTLPTYSETERVIAGYFDIVSVKPYGLFMPKLWTASSIGRILQPLFDALFTIAPNLFHEKIYLLRKKK